MNTTENRDKCCKDCRFYYRDVCAKDPPPPTYYVHKRCASCGQWERDTHVVVGKEVDSVYFLRGVVEVHGNRRACAGFVQLTDDDRRARGAYVPERPVEERKP